MEQNSGGSVSSPKNHGWNGKPTTSRHMKVVSSIFVMSGGKEPSNGASSATAVPYNSNHNTMPPNATIDRWNN